ncbi:PAS domain S-box protein [bacterium]|nr:PAS domain S-box protein [bacterium]
MVRLLLIEDEIPRPRLRGLVQDIKGMDLQVEHVPNGPSALGRLAHFEPDVCLLDRQVGESTDLGWTVELRNRGYQFPIIFWGSSQDTRAAAHFQGASYWAADQTQPGLLERTLQYATERGRSKAALQYFCHLQRVLAQLGQSALVTADFPSLMEQCLAGALGALGLEYGAIVESVSHSNSLVLRAGLGWSPSFRLGEALGGPVVESQAGYALKTGKPVVVEELSAEVRFRGSPLLHDHGVVSGVSVMIPGSPHPYGVLGVHTRSRRPFCADEVNFLSSVAEILAAAPWRSQSGQGALRARVCEQALAESPDFFASIVETAQLAIVCVDEEQRILLFNRAAEQMFGYLASQVAGRRLGVLLPDRFRTSHHQQVDSFGRRGPLQMHMGDRQEVVGLRADGQEFPIDASIAQLTTVDGHKRYTAIIRDMTSRKQAREKLAQSEARFRALFENALDAVLVADDEARYVEANPAACALLGVSGEKIVGSCLYDYLEPGVHELASDQWRDFLEHGAKRGIVRVFRPDGTSLVVDYAATARFLPGLNLSILRDVSRQRHLEAQLRQSQKLEAVGQLAGGIAHDFNNLLMVILGYSDEVRGRANLEESVQQCLDEIHHAAQQASLLTGQLLAFSRKQIVQPGVVDLNLVLGDLERMLSRLIREDIQLQTRLTPHPLYVRVDAGQIQQLIVNLVVNARDAMPRGGEIQLQTHDLVLDDDYVSHHLGVLPGRYAMLAVTDTGVGMSKELQKRVFEPFFTTKRVGEGTGLGLSTAFGIAAQAGGSIWLYSEIGLGSTFKVYLPAVASPPLGPDAVEDGELLASPGPETLLVVEDDESLRRLMARVLVSAGYTLLVARDGSEAQQVAAEHPHAIDLLLTDVVMPGMPGREVAEALLATRPHMKVLFMSGYTADAVVRLGIDQGAIHFIQKPFSLVDLKRKVRSLLDDDRS